jgi:hypothetical protein
MEPPPGVAFTPAIHAALDGPVSIGHVIFCAGAQDAYRARQAQAVPAGLSLPTEHLLEGGTATSI